MYFTHQSNLVIISPIPKWWLPNRANQKSPWPIILCMYMYLFYNFLFSFFTSFLPCIVSTYSHISRLIHALYYSAIETETNNQDSPPPPLALGLGPVCRKKRKKKRREGEISSFVLSYSRWAQSFHFINLQSNSRTTSRIGIALWIHTTPTDRYHITVAPVLFLGSSQIKLSAPSTNPSPVQSRAKLSLSLPLSVSLSLSLSVSLSPSPLSFLQLIMFGF